MITYGHKLVSMSYFLDHFVNRWFENVLSYFQAYDLLEERGNDAIHPGLQLLYSIQKNLAAMATKRKDYKSALDCYLEVRII